MGIENGASDRDVTCMDRNINIPTVEKKMQEVVRSKREGLIRE